VAAAARAGGKPEGKGFKGARVIPSGFKTLCVHSPFVSFGAAFLVDGFTGDTGSLGK